MSLPKSVPINVTSCSSTILPYLVQQRQPTPFVEKVVVSRGFCSLSDSIMSRYREPNDCKVYVGDLQKDASEKEIEKAFIYYGRLKSVWVARNPPGFAFVEFDDYRDAEDAVNKLDGSYMCGGRVRVELSTGKTRNKPWGRGGRGPPRGGGRRMFNPDDRCYECGDKGHYAYDCSKNKRGSGSGGGSSRSRRRSRLAKISNPSGLDQPTPLRIELVRPSIFMFLYNIQSSLTCFNILIELLAIVITLTTIACCKVSLHFGHLPRSKIKQHALRLDIRLSTIPIRSPT